MTALIRYDAARKAIAAAHRVDEAKKIRDKAEAVRTYAKLAGDLDMQNMAAEIRIRAERRAGQLLLEMEKNPGTRVEGRPRKDGTKIRRSVGATAYRPRAIFSASCGVRRLITPVAPETITTSVLSLSGDCAHAAQVPPRFAAATS